MPSFKPYLLKKVKEGTKTQTRRIAKEGERLVTLPDGTKTIYDSNGRIKWQTGRDYGCWPGRGLMSECRYDLHDLREEVAANISEGDAISEGFNSKADFLCGWDEINGANTRGVKVWVHVFRVKPKTVETRVS